MHIIQIVRNYLGLTQAELAKVAGISQADVCEMEKKPPYGRAEKYRRLSEYLGISVHALVTNNCSLIPRSFFDEHPCASYSESEYDGNMGIGRCGEDAAFEMEKARLSGVNPSLAKLVLPYYKMRIRPGFDILSFHEDGTPLYIEVKTTTDDMPEFVLTRQEYEKANKAVEAGETYMVYRYLNWGTTSQKLRIFDFEDIKKHNKIMPRTYLCSMADKVTEVSGITRCREAMDMSMKELAAYLGIAVHMLWRYEAGETACPVRTLQRMSEILGVRIDDLLKWYSSEKNGKGDVVQQNS